MEYEPLIRDLLRKTARLFYDPPHCVILDILLHKLILYDHELTSRLKLLTKEVNKNIVRLKEDKLIKIENKIENIEGRQVVKTLYYLDFCSVKDIIKYKVYKMSRSFESAESELYVCVACKKEFGLLDVQLLVVNFKFLCDECRGELVEKTADAGDVSLHKRMNTCIEELVELLRRIDQYDIETMDYFQVLKLREEREKLGEDNESEIIEKAKEEVQFEEFKDVDENKECEVFEDDNFEPVTELKEKVDSENNKEIKIDDENICKNFELLCENIGDNSVGNNLEEETNVEKTFLNEIVMVQGEKKLIHKITESDMGKMSEEEYINYYDIFSKYN
ncbi:hypothetical protein COBT_001666 [Conglomerata obtusa]